MGGTVFTLALLAHAHSPPHKPYIVATSITDCAILQRVGLSRKRSFLHCPLSTSKTQNTQHTRTAHTHTNTHTTGDTIGPCPESTPTPAHTLQQYRAIHCATTSHALGHPCLVSLLFMSSPYSTLFNSQNFLFTCSNIVPYPLLFLLD